MKIKTIGNEVESEIIVIPKIRKSSLKFMILCALSENKVLWAEDLAEMTGKKLSQIHSAVLSLKKDRLVNKFRKYIMITQAGKWYAKKYEVLAKTMWKRRRDTLSEKNTMEGRIKG